MSTRYLTAARALELAGKLSARDLAIAKTVCSLRCVSGSQLQRIHVPGGTPLGRVRTARRVLARLVELDVLARLSRRVGGPLGPGSDDYTYVLGLGGQRLARARGWLPPGRARKPAEIGLTFLAHRLAVAELHTLVIEGAQQGRYTIEALTPEPQCWRSYIGPGGIRQQLKPDSYTRLAAPDFIHANFIEVDLATESAPTIERKLRQYAAYYATGQESDPFPRVVFLVPSAVRAEVVIEAAGRLPADAWRLFRVTTFDRALEALTEVDRLPARLQPLMVSFGKPP
jgi:hypothetical protein